ncbi:MAG: hypothetical protein LC744_08975 [Chloroflexi bacterium]|nr:hypothetical protein [Chloroflexota bacterium]
MATAVTHPRAEFAVERSNRSLGYNLPQKLGRGLWLPMFLMALMAFPAAVALGIIRGDEISTGGSLETLEELRHVSAGFMAIGFAAVFAAVSFAIARILGAFRKGGGDVQEAAGTTVQTLKMPLTAKLFLAVMAMGMMALMAEAVLHFVFAADLTGSAASLELSEDRAIALEGVRRAAIGTYLFAITLGLASIITVLRFQARRIRELGKERRQAASG